MTGYYGQFLEQRPMLFTGKISYGLYLWHPLVMIATPDILARLGLSHIKWGSLGYVIALFALTFAIATLSWYLLEKPVNDLKRFFDYSGKIRRARQKRRSRAERRVVYVLPDDLVEQRAELDHRAIVDRRIITDRRSNRAPGAVPGGASSRRRPLVVEHHIHGHRRLQTERRAVSDRRRESVQITHEKRPVTMDPGLETVWGPQEN